MAGKLRKRFTDAEVFDAYEKGEGQFGATADILSEEGRGVISPELVRYWVRQLTEVTKADGTPFAGSGPLDRIIREAIQIRVPKQEDDDRQALVTPEDNSSILVIPDQHAPYTHPQALDFLDMVANAIKPTRVINLGDETDKHAMSFHDSDPNLDSAGQELENAKVFIHALAARFPVMDICHSNHGSLAFRRAMKAGIPVQYLRSYRDVLFPDGGGEGWEWKEKIILTLPNGDKTMFQHQSAGDILANAAMERCNLIEGHQHARFEIQYRASNEYLFFSSVAGCLVDHKALAFAYGKNFPKKPILGCLAIIDSIPQLFPMLLDSNGNWVGRLT